MKNKIGNRYDWLKVTATVLVVLAHATRMYTGFGVVNPAVGSPVLAELTDLIYSFHMPLFLFLSGAVYSMCVLDLGKYGDTGKFLRNKAKRLLIPYFALGFFYVAPVMCLLGFDGRGYFSYCLDGILLARDSRHLWYLLVLFWIFAVCALGSKLPIKPNSILVWLVLARFSYYAGDYSPTLCLNRVILYAHYFVAGYIVNKYKEKCTAVCRKPLILLLLAGIFGLAYVKKYELTCAYAMILLLFGISGYFPAGESSRVFRVLKRNSFGIYLFHPMVIYVLFYLFGQAETNPYCLCSCIAAASFVLSVGLTELVRKLHLGILIGES